MKEPIRFLGMAAAVVATLFIGYLAGGVLLKTGTPRVASQAQAAPADNGPMPPISPRREPVLPALPAPPEKGEKTADKPAVNATPSTPSESTLSVKELSPPAKANLVPAPSPSQGPAASRPAPALAPVGAPGTVLLQVAAVTRADKALTLAETLTKKGFGSFVRNPDVDNFYRVQVGPFRDMQSARAARDALLAQGFPSFVRLQ